MSKNKAKKDQSAKRPTLTTKDNVEQNTEQKTAICRSFEFFHNKVTNDINEGNILVALGFFDYFRTQKIDGDSNSSLGLDRLYINTINNAGKSFPSQKMYGFCKINNQEATAKEENFWSEGSIYIVSFLYFDIETDNTAVYNTLYEIVNDCVYHRADAIRKDNCDIKIDFQLYYSLDKADLILCVKSNSYTSAVKCVESVYEKSVAKSGFNIEHGFSVNLAYTYSHLVVKTKNVDDIKNNEYVDSICIKAMINNKPINNPIKIDDKIGFYCLKLKEKLYDKGSENIDLVGYEILGETDCRIIARNVKLLNLLSLFKEAVENKDNLLNVNNKYYKVCFVSSMTSLNVKKYEYKKVDGNEIEKTAISEDSKEQLNKVASDYHKDKFANGLISQCKYVLSNKSGFEPYKNTLYVIANYIDSMKCNQYFTNFDKQSLLEEAFIGLLEIIRSPSSKNIELKEIGEYINSIYAIIQSNWYSDFRTIQMADFSIVPYYSPVKLRLFYHRIVRMMSEYFKSYDNKKDNKNEYLFLVVPQNYGIVHTKQLFKEEHSSDRPRLHLVYVPEIDLYNSNNLFIMLAHEVSHFVGSDEIRLRKRRLIVFSRLIINTLIYAVVDNFYSINNKHSVERVIDNFFCGKQNLFDDYVDSFIKIYCNNVANKIKSKMKNDENSESDETVYYYRHWFKECVDYSIVCFQNKNKLTVVICKMIQYALSQKSKDVDAKEYSNIIQYIDNDSKKSAGIEPLSHDINLLCIMDQLLYECYADISAILMLNISLKEYYQCIIDQLLRINKTPQIFILTVYRIFVVYKAFKSTDDKSGLFDIKNNVPENFNSLLQILDKKFKKPEQIIKILINYEDSFDNMQSNNNDNIFLLKKGLNGYNKNSACSINELYMLSLVIEYLSKCLNKQIDSLATNIDCVNSRKKITDLRQKIYPDTQNDKTPCKDIVDIVVNINDSILGVNDSSEGTEKQKRKKKKKVVFLEI